jgi:hypothetical protein
VLKTSLSQNTRRVFEQAQLLIINCVKERQMTGELIKGLRRRLGLERHDVRTEDEEFGELLVSDEEFEGLFVNEEEDGINNVRVIINYSLLIIPSL